MTAADHAKRVRRFDLTAIQMHCAWRVCVCLGNQAAAAIALENRNIARRMHLEAFADELLAAPMAVS